MERSIIFILTSIVNPNSIKRIDEFVSRGYKVCAYGFKREIDVPNKSKYVDIEVLGSFKNNLSYIKRCTIIYHGIKKVLQETEGHCNLYYLVGLDVAMLFKLQSKSPYIFEEADLVHTNIANSWIRKVYERVDKLIIRKSVLSAFRSEGFVKYHFGDNVPDNVHVISNRLNIGIKDFEVLPQKPVDFEHLKIGYVGFIRYKSILNFAKVFCREFPQHEFHFYGTFTSETNERSFSVLKGYKNCIFHGSFKSPDELNKIYSQIDMVLSTYDVSSENVRYAEPNKIYESIYFETPIVVSSGTFLADKVKMLGVGYDIDAMNDDEIIKFVSNLSEESLLEKKQNAQKIDKRETLNINEDFFKKLDNIINTL